MRVRLLLALVSLGSGPALLAQECRPVRTALVLSGGGAKGLAHIGLLAILDSLGFRPDLIVGTSIGAIVGALYASGYTAREIDSLARHLPVAEIVRPFRTPAPHPWDQRIPLLFMVKGRHGFEFQTGIVDEAEPNALLNAALLRGNLLARGRFDRLPIPFLAVATDLRDRSTVVLQDGDLARAVRASSAIPLVFPPVVLGDAILVDGGLSANIPIAQARAAGAERVIVSDVTEHPEDSLDVESPLALADQLLGFLFQQPPADLSAADLFIRPDVQEFRSLDFSPETVQDLLARGRRAARAALAGAVCLPRRPPVAIPPLPTRLGTWTVTTGTTADSALLTRMLRLSPGSALEPERLRQRLAGLADAEAFRGVWLNPTGGPDTVSFNVEPIRAPETVGGIGVAYDNELGGRVWGGLFDRRVFGTTLEASALVSLGRFQRGLYTTALGHLGVGGVRVAPIASFRVRSEDIRRFDADGNDLPSLATGDSRFSAGLEIRTGRAWRVRLGADALIWGARGVRGDGSLGGSVRLERVARWGPSLDGEVLVTGAFQSVRLESAWPLIHRTWSLIPGVRLGWGSELPLQWTFPLGGDDGFPGLHLGERRGSRELEASLGLRYAVKGPIEVRLKVAAGRAWSPGGIPGQDWLGGARLGLGADTPAGPVDVAWGVATNGRSAFFVRLGRWF